MSKMFTLDPRVKLFLFVVTCCFAMSVTEPISCICLGVFLGVLLWLSGEKNFAVKSLLVMIPAVICSAYFISKISNIGGMLLLGICMLARMIILIVMAFTLVFRTTRTSQFMSALQKMKVPVHILIPIIIMFRFIPTVQEEWNGIRKAMLLKGISFGPVGIIRHPVTAIEHTLVPLLFSADTIIDELAAASLARGLDGDRPRTCLIQAEMKKTDYICLSITVIYMGIIILKWLR